MVNCTDDAPQRGRMALWELTAWLRRATVLLAVERSGLKKALDPHGIVHVKSVDGTSARLLKAGAILGMFQCDPSDSYSWSCDYHWVRTDTAKWTQMIAIIRQHLSYLNLVESSSFWSENPLLPAAQLAMDPAAYRSFLDGVAASHRKHAHWLSQIDELATCQSLADLGGGLGTYALAWVNSSPKRRATIIDLPGVQTFLIDLLRLNTGRLDFAGEDLTKPFSLPPGTDFVLFANVLHLVPAWNMLLERTIRTANSGCTVGIFEADPTTSQGVLFDLQVHLRSGRVTGLLDPAIVTITLTSCGLTNIRHLKTGDPDDPFQREYNLWLGQVPTSGAAETT